MSKLGLFFIIVVSLWFLGVGIGMLITSIRDYKKHKEQMKMFDEIQIATLNRLHKVYGYNTSDSWAEIVKSSKHPKLNNIWENVT